MNKYLISLVLIIMSNNALSINYEKFADLYNQAISIVKFDNLNKNQYDDSLIVNSFDFKLFKEVQNFNSCYTYKLYRKSGKLNKIECFNEKRIFDLFLYHNDTNYIFYTGYFYNKNSEGEFAKGFFIYDKINRDNYFVSIDENLFSNIEVDNVQYYNMLFLDDSCTKDILRIYKLNDDLKPISKASFLKNELLCYSEIKHHKDKLVEEIAIYARRTCHEYIYLDTSRMFVLYKLFNGDLCDDGKLIMIDVDYNLGFGDNSWLFSDH